LIERLTPAHVTWRRLQRRSASAVAPQGTNVDNPGDRCDGEVACWARRATSLL